MAERRTALDIMQETFLRLWKQLGSGQTILNPRVRLLRVARNLAEDHAKSAFRKNGTHPPQTMNGVPAHEPLPLDNLEREETFARLRDVMDQMPKSDREILTLRYALNYENCAADGRVSTRPFRLSNEDDVHELDENRARITDAHGIRYPILGIEQLDANSRRLLERYL